jgi:hypothetical protein
MNPQRIQLSRKKGWKLPPNTVVVARPRKWGNPYRVGQTDVDGSIIDQAKAVRLFRLMMKQTACVSLVESAQRELRGKNLACWCRPGTPCHADVLLEIANT